MTPEPGRDPFPPRPLRPSPSSLRGKNHDYAARIDVVGSNYQVKEIRAALDRALRALDTPADDVDEEVGQ